MNLADLARNYWNAAFFYRRAPDRDQRVTIAVLKQVSTMATGEVKTRADALLKEIDHGSDKHPPRAG